MKWKITFIGLLTIFAGLWPLLDKYSILSIPFPLTFYFGLIILIGVVDLLYSFLAQVDLIGMQHMVTGIIALMTIAGGVLPLLTNIGVLNLPKYIPTSGLPHSILIIVIGIIGMLYGFSQLRY